MIALALATMRLTDVLIFDRIAAPLRARVRWYVLTCPRCLSVWMGAVCTVVWLYAPLVLYPLALSWLYLRAARR
jgi:hypothetical protein